MEVEKENKKEIIVCYICLIIAILVFVSFVIFEIFIGAKIVPMIVTFVWIVWMYMDIKQVKKGNKNIQKTKWILKCIIMLLINIYLNAFSWGFTSRSTWKYTLQKEYVQDKKGSGKINWLLEELPDNIENYKMSYMPPLMQGSVCFHVRFETEKKMCQSLENKYKTQAIYTLTIAQYINGEFTESNLQENRKLID